MVPLDDSRQDDALLIAQSLDRPEVFAALYDRHASAIHRFVVRRLGDEAADDVVADTFLTAFQRRERYQLERPDARPWLYGIATRLIGRQRRREVRLWRAIAKSGPDPHSDGGLVGIDDRLAAQDLQRELAAALAGLSAGDRDVLLLFAWADLSYEEIACAVEIPVGTVRSRLSRARRQLRAELRGWDRDPSTEELCHERA